MICQRQVGEVLHIVYAVMFLDVNVNVSSPDPFPIPVMNAQAKCSILPCSPNFLWH